MLHCRVQFDRRELGVELVKDVDVMPIDPLDSLPPTLLSASGHLLLNGRRATNGVPQVPARTPLWSGSTLRLDFIYTHACVLHCQPLYQKQATPVGIEPPARGVSRQMH